MAKGKLTEKQKRFVQEYLVDLNATAAAQRAGYKDPNIGRQLITKNNVSAAIQEAIEKRQNRVEITQDRVLQELASIAFAKGTDYASIISGIVMMNDTGELTEEQKAAIVSIKQTKEGVEVKLADKMKALELLARHLGLLQAQEKQEDGMLPKLIEGLKG
ncbi:terminase small subunit [Acutalibacter intestini]|uniref:terminase small subunit n=1 Tax=Acutalibacter intestini TaxID=3093659 RepID=UPI002AC8973C|nr:terminase small subunit [Acutalibacter sp. M00204]